MSVIRRSKKRFLRALLKLLERIYDRAEGRQLLSLHMPYMQDVRSSVFADTVDNYPNPYTDDAGTVPPRGDIVDNDRVIFVSGRFRSGSTLLWNIFRDIPGCTAYYEPFNERRWFDRQARGENTDKTHLGVEEYWTEYDGLEALGEFFQESWGDRRLYMSANSWDPGMMQYIDSLIRSAPGRAVLQFNRIDFRLAWVRQHYPNARIVHIYRNPRDQWLSFIKEAALCSPDTNFDALGIRDFFYLRRWGVDLRSIFPFLEESGLNHPYELFYFIWRLSYNHGRAHADYSFKVEDLTADPQATLAGLFAAVDIDKTHMDTAALKVKATASKWPGYADAAWFDIYEAKCEAVLADFYSVRAQPDNTLRMES